MIYAKYKERKKCSGVGTAGVGTVGGLIVGVCPLCVAGVFPLILGIIGISFSFASLPFQGIEIQVIVALVLFFSFRKLSRNNK